MEVPRVFNIPVSDRRQHFSCLSDFLLIIFLALHGIRIFFSFFLYYSIWKTVLRWAQISAVPKTLATLSSLVDSRKDGQDLDDALSFRIFKVFFVDLRNDFSFGKW